MHQRRHSTQYHPIPCHHNRAFSTAVYSNDIINLQFLCRCASFQNWPTRKGCWCTETISKVCSGWRQGLWGVPRRSRSLSVNKIAKCVHGHGTTCHAEYLFFQCMSILDSPVSLVIIPAYRSAVGAPAVTLQVRHRRALCPFF